MKGLIQINIKRIGSEKIETVNLRTLHHNLRVKRDYSNWVKGRIEKYRFDEGIDYIKIATELKTGAQNKIEYHGTLDMAKELAMLEENEIGRKVRRYFIDYEKNGPKVITSWDWYNEKIGDHYYLNKLLQLWKTLQNIGRDLGVPSRERASYSNAFLIEMTGIDVAAVFNRGAVELPLDKDPAIKQEYRNELSFILKYRKSSDIEDFIKAHEKVKRSPMAFKKLLNVEGLK